MANRLIKAGLIDLVDPRQSMIRMVAMPTSLDLRPPTDPAVALMDDRRGIVAKIVLEHSTT